MVLLILAILGSFVIGRYPVSLREVGGIVLSFFIDIPPFWSDNTVTALFSIRLPRIFLALLIGCALSAAGCAYQGVFQNPMASPDILGVSSGAAFGASLAIVCGASFQIITISAFCMSLLTIGLVFLISKRARGKQIINIILSGIMVSALVSAGISVTKLYADPNRELPAIELWQMGGLSGSEPEEVLFILLPLVLGLVPLILLRWRINVLTLGEDEAKSMGVDAKKLRIIVILSATLTTAACVSISGVIGWIGLIIPNLCRKLVGNDYRTLMPVSMLSGALFLLLIDNISRTLLVTEIPLSVLTAFVGAPFFLYLITRNGANL